MTTSLMTDVGRPSFTKIPLLSPHPHQNDGRPTSVIYTDEMELYHVLNRGVEKRAIVNDDSDRLRFVHSLFIFNDAQLVDSNHRRRNTHKSKSKRDELVYIHAWCLMKNHYHLLISPVDDDLSKLSQFMKKLNGGYAKYFNERHKRSGYLWQGKYKKIHIEQDAHFMHIPYYIHLNPLDYSMPQWREGKVENFEKALEDLAAYRWSSHLDYLGTKNFPSVISKELLSDTLGKPNTYVKNIASIISSPVIAPQSQIIE